jgi:hypothetical protein
MHTVLRGFLTALAILVVTLAASAAYIQVLDLIADPDGYFSGPPNAVLTGPDPTMWVDLEYSVSNQAAAGNYPDSGAYGRHAFQTNGNWLATWTNDTGNGCLSFDGDDHVDGSNTYAGVFTNSFTISIWAKADDGRPSGNTYFYGTRDTGNNNQVAAWLSNFNGKMYWQYIANGGNAYYGSLGNNLLNDGQTPWFHICWVLDSGVDMYFYLDGQLVAKERHASDFNTVTMADLTMDQNFIWGALHQTDGSHASPWQGELDTSKVFDYAMTSNQVNTLWGEGR